MARVNTKTAVPKFTHEGAKAPRTTVEQDLRRTVLSTFLWEDGFYEDGVEIAQRMKDLVARAPAQMVAELAVEARTVYKLRHAPLFLVRELARKKGAGSIVGRTLSEVIQRADELAEFLAIYWKEKKQPLSKQVKIGLAHAFNKFDAYQLAKYNRDNDVKLRDVLFMVHAKPKDDEQAAVWKKLVDGTLESPDTWEVALSAGADKKGTFERLLSENKLGYMALLRNLRNMHTAGVDTKLVFKALREGAAKSRALPFRYVSAARAVPAWEMQIDESMQIALGGLDRLPGKTVWLVDISGSMDEKVSAKSDLTRKDAASALAVMGVGVCEEAAVYTFDTSCRQIPTRKGMALIDAIRKSGGGGTYLGAAIEHVNRVEKYDRLVVITDEQSHDQVGIARNGRGYMLNVGVNKNGVGYGKNWIHIDGFSEATINYIQAYEKEFAQ